MLLNLSVDGHGSSSGQKLERYHYWVHQASAKLYGGRGCYLHACLHLRSSGAELVPAAQSLTQCQRAVQRFPSKHPCCAKAAAGF